MKVLIAGAGIGGLTAALACAQFGHEVVLFERADALTEVGAGIQVPPNAMKVFAALGLADDIAANAFRPEAIEARMGETGRTLFTIPLADHAVRVWGAPYLHIHRADYIAALANALELRCPGTVRLGTGVSAYRNTGAGVEVTLSNGEIYNGDILIGADGIHSAVRAQMQGADAPVFTGNVAWRAVVPMDALGPKAPNPTACAWMGPGRHAVTYRLRRGTLANFVGVVERNDWTREGWSERGDIAEARQDFAGWHPTITAILDAVPDGRLYRWALFDRAPLSRWSDTHVTLLGDAAHPMLPFLAQGAAMAVEDAWVLARALSGVAANMGTFHQRTSVGRAKTYGPMWLAGRVAPALVHRRMDWLYGHDVTA